LIWIFAILFFRIISSLIDNVLLNQKIKKMKKTYSLLSMLLVCQFMFAQVVLTEDFSGTAWPPDGWTISTQPGNWSRAQSNNAGGEVPELRLSWSPQFNATTHFISPPMDLTGNSKVLVMFRHSVDHYSDSYDIGLATRSGGASGTWNPVWTQTVSSSIPAQQELVIVENDDVNQADFQIALFFSGNSWNINYWYIDDVSVSILPNLDAAMASVNVPSLFAGEQEVSGIIQNLGSTTINTMNVNWQLNAGMVHTTSFSDMNLETGLSYEFLADDPINVDPGTYQLKVWLSEVNGLPGDDVPENDTITKTISVVDQANLRKPLFESFSASTCPPCAPFNNNVMHPFKAQYGHMFTLIKYQMNWPGQGDPYYTAEGGVRRTYYGINAVPAMVIEGAVVATNWGAVYAAYENALNDPAFMEISSQHMVEGDTVTISAIITAHGDLQDVVAHIVVIENTTYGNVGSNGETFFTNIMMKMVPDANGTIVNLEAGVPFNLTYSQDMSGTFVEEMDDLSVVVFVQNNADKSIYQSAYSVEVTSFGIPGDSNCDGEVNVLDVVTTVNFVLGNNPEPFCFENADVNEDGVINVIDVVGTVNIVIGGTKSANIPIKSEPAGIYLAETGIELASDGTLAGLQVEISGVDLNEMTFLLEGYEFAASAHDGIVRGLIFSFDNRPLPAGIVKLFDFTSSGSDLSWGKVTAANVNANEVKLSKYQNSIVSFANEDFKALAYPNPSQGDIHLELFIPEISFTEIRMLDLMGKEVAVLHSGILTEGDHKFQSNQNNELSPGIYILQLRVIPEHNNDQLVERVIRIMITR
jgi:hypothetical protein